MLKYNCSLLKTLPLQQFQATSSTWNVKTPRNSNFVIFPHWLHMRIQRQGQRIDIIALGNVMSACERASAWQSTLALLRGPDFWWKERFLEMRRDEMRWDAIYIYLYTHMYICIFVYMLPLFPLYIIINNIYIYISWYTFRWYTVNTAYPHQPNPRFANRSSPVSGHKTNGVNIILYNSSISACAKSDVWQATGRSWGV